MVMLKQGGDNMKLNNYKVLFVFIFLFVLYLILSHGAVTVFAQKTLESGGLKNIAAENDSPADAASDKIVAGYFECLFAKNYEEAVKLMPENSRAESEIARLERWREKFMSPSGLKIINSRSNKDGTITATVTFSYMNPNGVKDIMREKLTLAPAGGGFSVKSLHGADNASSSAASQPPSPAASSATPVTPVTMTPNATAMPDMSSLLSALSGGSAGSGNIDPGELLGLMTELVNDPDVLALTSNPKIMEISKDPTIMSTLLSGNMAAIEANPKIKELLSDPAIRKIIEKVSSKRSAPSSHSGSEQTNPPSSINGIDVDKIFE